MSLKTLRCCTPMQSEPYSLWYIGDENTIEFLKQQLADRYELQVQNLSLLYNSTVLKEEKTLGYYQIHEDSLLHLIPRMSAGR